ncbi:MAG: cell wall anchor protein [Coprobacter sp.]|nr:cell wall anchor protein [Coprobacter sp.]
MKYNNWIKGLSLALAMLVSLTVSAQRVVVSARMDSTAIWMGEQTTIHLEMVQDKNSIVQMPLLTDTLVSGVEILDFSVPDTADLENNRVQIKSDVLVTSFDSGFYYIPPFRYILDKDTFETEALSLKVVPIDVDTTQVIFDIKGVQAPPFVLWDFIPDWLLVAVGILLCLAIILFLLYRFWWSKRGQSVEPLSPEDLLPPHIKALNALEAVKEGKLWQNGQEKEYYTRITEILREYLDDRFSVNAMEMTTSEILEVLHKNEETKIVNHKLKEILEMADFVKFAKLRPMPEDNEAVMRSAVYFVEETKPAETVENEPDLISDGEPETE